MNQNIHPNYQQNRNFLSRRVLFLHVLDILAQIRQTLKSSQLRVDHLPTIKAEDSARIQADLLYQEHDFSEGEEYTRWSVIRSIYHQNKSSFIYFSVLSILTVLSELVGLFLLEKLIDLVSDPKHIDHQQLYLVNLGAGFFLVLKATLHQNVSIDASILPLVVKHGLILMIFEKVSTLSQFVVETQEIGKLTNMLSNDFNTIETKVSMVFLSISLPIRLIGVSYILFQRIGVITLFLFLVIIFSILFQLYLGKLEAKYQVEVNESKDKRIKIYTQLLEGIKTIKMYGWELAFSQIIQKIRELQVGNFMKLKAVKSVDFANSQFTVYFASLLCFLAMFSFQKQDSFSSASILVVLQMVLVLNMSLKQFSFAVSVLFNLSIIIDRFVSIMNAKNLRLQALEDSATNFKTQGKKGQIKIIDFCGYWKKPYNQEIQPTLKNINFCFEDKKFYGIIGKVGSGKSSLFSAIFEEIPYCRGKIIKNGEIAYVEQEPIIFSTTLKENIVFGRQFYEQKYHSIIECCCFDEDIRQWENRDETLIGERGLTLSGGQKARLALARALYSDSDIYLLDDPLSAVDVKVGRKMYHSLIRLLKGKKTLIMVTHQTHFLSNCDELLEMEEGRMKRINFSKNQEKEQEIEKNAQKMQQSTKNINLHKKEKNVEVSLKSYFTFFFYSRLNFVILSLAIVMFFGSQILISLIFIFYTKYDAIKRGEDRSFETFTTFWLVLGLFHILAFILMFLKAFLVEISALQSTQKIHRDMVMGIVRSPLSFFDVVSSGQITNKFSNDLGILDTELGQNLIFILDRSTMWVIAFGTIIHLDVIYMIPAIVCLVFFILFTLINRRAIIKSKEFSLKLKSPIFSQLRQMMLGLIPIQTLRQRFRFIEKFTSSLNESLRAQICFVSIERAFGITISMFTAIALITGLQFGIMGINEQNAILFGVQSLFVFRLTDVIQFLIRSIITSEVLMINVERCFQIVNLPPEKQLASPYDQQVSQLEGNIEMKGVDLRYREDLPLVLDQISFFIGKKQKVGIVGRTGAGKSSIIQALLRTVEPERGQYWIGGKDALKMGLHFLRKSFSVIPQNPFIFKGTIRQNIDPFEEKTEEELWWSLQTAGLKAYIENLPDKLETDISNASDIFSVGQKQLLCLARALINGKQFLVMDEPTSNVDRKTDDFIQQCIKEQFRNATIITIAHRLTTIIDYDRILVIENGAIVEEGSPSSLVSRNGRFAKMLASTGKQLSLIKDQ